MYALMLTIFNSHFHLSIILLTPCYSITLKFQLHNLSTWDLRYFYWHGTCCALLFLSELVCWNLNELGRGKCYAPSSMSEHLPSRITCSLLIYQGIFALQIIISACHAMLCTSLCKGISFTLFSMTSPFSITVNL